MKNLKDILVSAFALMLIAGLVTAALAGTNALTKDTIAQRTEEVETAARMEVLPAERFEKLTVSVDGIEQDYYTAYTDDAVVGYVFATVANGKSSGLAVMTGIDADGKIVGVKVTDDNETAGYVDKVVKAGFLTSLANRPAQPLNFKKDIDAVSQATKTSKGVCDAVNKAIALYQVIKEGGENGK